MPTPRKIYIKYHTNTYLPQFLLPDTLSMAFKILKQKKITEDAKAGKEFWKDKAGIRGIILIRHGLSDRNYKVSLINMFKALSFKKIACKSRQSKQ